ncbi:LytR C-terminal domain-containing protein [uncultured Modestobacter sp.]|uniref:LytR C-terminal domain-containing protein n=1 Tax=uncultured Modestobacter sp. TaxID=380048 RepID=UPI002606FAE4|nr:LytR C-terminal domain-containing protein [uncultured Modestobacter sp.]
MTETASETGTRRPAGGPRNRRPLPALVFLLVLALAALAVWWNVLGDERARKEAQAAACSSAENAPEALDPATVTLRVLNASDVGGRAGEVAAQLQSLGFVVQEIANDQSDHEVTGVGELRYGPAGGGVADYVQLYLPQATERRDTRATTVVDVVLGPDYAGLASAEDVAAALAPAENAEAASC